MRRGKLTPQSIFFIVLAGFFTLSSYFLDQRVIIKEDEIRDVNFLLEKKYQKLEEESSNAENLTYLSNRVAIETHQNNSISTINYKFHLFIKNNREVVENFDKSYSVSEKFNVYDFFSRFVFPPSINFKIKLLFSFIILPFFAVIILDLLSSIFSLINIFSNVPS